MKQLDISRRVFVLVVVVGVLALTGWLTHAKAIPEAVTTSILMTLVATLPALINAMAGTSNGNGTTTGNGSSPTATTIPPKPGAGNGAALMLMLPLPALLLGGLLSCTPAAQAQGARILGVSADVCVAIARSRGRDDVATVCGITEDAARVIETALADQVCTVPADAGADQ